VATDKGFEKQLGGAPRADPSVDPTGHRALHTVGGERALLPTADSYSFN